MAETLSAAHGVDLSHLATKEDLQREVRDLELRMIKWSFALLLGQAALIVALLK